MHPHSNVVQVKVELFILAIGLPICGLVAAVILWQRARRRGSDEQAQHTALGLRSTAFAFAAYLIWLGLTSLPGRYHTAFATLILILLSMTGTIAGVSGLGLILLRARGRMRIGGATLSVLAFAYAVISGLLLLTGGAA